MALINVTSPHATGAPSTGQVMRQVLLACLPGLLALLILNGPGVLLNVLGCVTAAVCLEAACVRARARPVAFYLRDGSAVVTGMLLGLAIPPSSPWWIGLTGMLFAIPVAKHLYGGLGSNPFNPAMVAYALLLVSFPAEMTRWNIEASSWQMAWQAFLGNNAVLDHLTGATPLDQFRQAAKTPGNLSGVDVSWPDAAWVNAAFLLGGLYLLARRLISWHIPVAMLVMLAVCATGFHLFNPARFGSAVFHLLSGATMLGAFFIATDPVTAATSRRGQLIYGAGIGLLVFIIRTWGGYPDAVAFAVLLMNLAAPTIDHLVRPRTFGHDVKPVKWTGGQS